MTATSTPVLLVEDDPLVLDCTAQLLSDGGCSVVRATSAGEAIAAIEAGPVPQMVVTDIELASEEGQSGLDLARIVAERWPQVRLLIVSGAERPAKGEYPDGAVFFTKPYAGGALLEMVNSPDW
jgi:CheY-like chemotaxis protein